MHHHLAKFKLLIDSGPTPTTTKTCHQMFLAVFRNRSIKMWVLLLIWYGGVLLVLSVRSLKRISVADHYRHHITEVFFLFPDVERVCHMVSSQRHHIAEVFFLFPDVERVCHMVISRRHHIVEVFFLFPDVERMCHIVSSQTSSEMKGEDPEKNILLRVKPPPPPHTHTHGSNGYLYWLVLGYLFSQVATLPLLVVQPGCHYWWCLTGGGGGVGPQQDILYPVPEMREELIGLNIFYWNEFILDCSFVILIFRVLKFRVFSCWVFFGDFFSSGWNFVLISNATVWFCLVVQNKFRETRLSWFFTLSLIFDMIMIPGRPKFGTKVIMILRWKNNLV